MYIEAPNRCRSIDLCGIGVRCQDLGHRLLYSNGRWGPTRAGVKNWGRRKWEARCQQSASNQMQFVRGEGRRLVFCGLFIQVVLTAFCHDLHEFTPDALSIEPLPSC